MNTQYIVIAKVEETQVWDGEPYARDLGARAGMKTVRTARAATWCHQGDAAELAKARKFAAEEGWMVFTFPKSTDEAFAAAKRKAIAAK